MRLPHADLDGYSLRSGVAMSELHPETFHIPAASRRARVAKGDIVKLSFEYADDVVEEIDGAAGERMWVKMNWDQSSYLGV